MDKNNDLVMVAKRENNNKRKYLVVNPLQGKHVPVSPNSAMNLFSRLAEAIKNEYINEKVLLVGFAETATAIGAALAIELNTYYIQTTREAIPNVGYLFFSEAHSHATEQKIVKDDLEEIISKIDRIIFVEDEVTTGNTILNIVNIIDKLYPNKVSFSVASILNGMDDEALISYSEKNIPVHYVLKTNHSFYTEKAEQFKGNGIYVEKNIGSPLYKAEEVLINIGVNARRCITGQEYLNACNYLWDRIIDNKIIENEKKVLVIGTEEFMYPAIYVAKKIEEMNIDVKCHSTTRSPIAVSLEDEYPVHIRYELTSLYDDNRRTFIYDLEKYDKVIIVTDAINEAKDGTNSLINALYSCENNNITVVRWC